MTRIQSYQTFPPIRATKCDQALESPDYQHWQAGLGYVEVGLFLEANQKKIQRFNRATPEVLAVRGARLRVSRTIYPAILITRAAIRLSPEQIRFSGS